jgi:putative protein kinase ArgK-like GTPase of G3E family
MSTDISIERLHRALEGYRRTLTRLRKEKDEWMRKFPNASSSRWLGDIAIYENCIDHTNEKLEKLGESNPQREMQRELTWDILKRFDDARKLIRSDAEKESSVRGIFPDDSGEPETEAQKLWRQFELERAKLVDM